MVGNFPTFFCLLIIWGLNIYAQEVKITGTVSDQGGKPLTNASIHLAGMNELHASTDNNGAFNITASHPVQPSPSGSNPFESIKLNKGIVLFDLKKSTQVTIELFDLKGGLQKQFLNTKIPTGTFWFNVNKYAHSSSIMVLRVYTGRTGKTFRFVHLPGSPVSEIPHPSIYTSGNLEQLQTSVDHLIVSATGYLTKEIALPSYQIAIMVSLDTVTMQRFSFFVTSLAGLQELSGNENGFGGDLRFGFTGPGAGLHGADNICESLAEMSMPGSKAKIWRAFLSAKDDGNGTPVNAIDRIGNGPWYDRRGRLWADKKTELLNDRPPNADPAIINDIPNEFGIPNHRPDPTFPVVDNHLTVTGSNRQGLLYDHERDGKNESLFGNITFPGKKKQTSGGKGFSTGGKYPENPTCDDWTSTTAQSSPRAGFSWPQVSFGNFSGKNWLSVWSMSGCEAGFDLDPSTGPGVAGIYTIGNGGGYGGFYCFALTP